MNKIVILDEKTANQIAAGEVIERPASVVKEMVENSIDAGATQITVEIKNGGISYIRVTDNGNGIDGEDLEFAFERHATSKIRRIEDLDALSTMGFRGEALASIASVSHLEVTSKTQAASTGTKLNMEGGRVISVTQTGSPKGTSFIVRNLFYNTPARYKFLKKDSTEAGYVSDIVERLALANPGISFKFIQNNQTQLHTPGNHDLLSVIYSVFGKDIAKSVLPVNYEGDEINLTGFIGKPEIARGNRNNQSIFLNGRYIKSSLITKALEEAYKTMLMQKKFPFCVLLLEAPPQYYDVNVHPQKLEVRFANENSLFGVIYHGVKNTLLNETSIRNFEPKNDKTVNKQESAAPEKPIISAQAGYNEITNTGAGISEPKQASIFDNPPINEFALDRSKSTSDAIHKISEPEPIIYETENFVNYENEQDAKGIEKKATCSQLDQPKKIGALNDLLDAQIVGQAFDTYIMLQKGDNLYIIDQHAAHERIRYETLKRRLQQNENFSQLVLEPFIIKLKPIEYDFVLDKQEVFQRLGFDIESFGSSTVILRSIPDFYDSSFNIGDFNEILDRWIQIGSNESEISDETIFMISCKGALKANRILSKEEIWGLVNHLNGMENPFTCVHGRPVVLTMEKKEFEKRFKRIV